MSRPKKKVKKVLRCKQCNVELDRADECYMSGDEIFCRESCVADYNTTYGLVDDDLIEEYGKEEEIK